MDERELLKIERDKAIDAYRKPFLKRCQGGSHSLDGGKEYRMNNTDLPELTVYIETDALWQSELDLRSFLEEQYLEGSAADLAPRLEAHLRQLGLWRNDTRLTIEGNHLRVHTAGERVLPRPPRATKGQA